MTPLIEARGLTIGHNGKALAHGIDLSLAPGRVLCLLGPNGVGKTTLFRTLMGLTPALSGTITLSGEPLPSLSRSRIARHLAHVPQGMTTPFAFTALDIVLMGAATRLGPFARPGPTETRRARAALDHLGIAALADHAVTQLSGGQRQLVLIARALAQEATTIIMDEPTASLDFANRLQVNEAIRGLARAGTAVILSTHDPDQAASLADEAVLLAHQGVIGAGPVDKTLTPAALAALYGVPVRRIDRPDGRAHFY